LSRGLRGLGEGDWEAGGNSIWDVSGERGGTLFEEVLNLCQPSYEVFPNPRSRADEAACEKEREDQKARKRQISRSKKWETELLEKSPRGNIQAYY